MSALYSRRRRGDTTIRVLCYASAVFGLSFLGLILFTLFWNGLAGLNLSVFTEMTPPPGRNSGGLANALVGSLMITVLGVAIGAPLGMLAGTYLAEYGRHEKLTTVIRFINDILLSAPSIIIGLFVYVAVVLPMGGFSGLAGALALAVIVIPVVVRTTEDMLLLVPNPLREAAAALGMPARSSSSGWLIALRRPASSPACFSPPRVWRERRRRCSSPRSTISSGASISQRRWRTFR